MKHILYINFSPEILSASSGVAKKIKAKLEALNQNGVDAKLISFIPGTESDTDDIIRYRLSGKKFLSSFESNKNLYSAIDKYLSNHADKFDSILMRYPSGSRGLYKLTKKFKNKFVFEHNTIEENEMKYNLDMRRKQFKFSVKPGYFIYRFEGFFWPQFSEKYYAGKIFRYAKAGIAVTDEIASYEHARNSSYKTVCISNGYQANGMSVPDDQRKELFKKNQLNFVFVRGTDAPWHGTDRVLKGFLNYKGTVDIKLFLVGKFDVSVTELAKYKPGLILTGNLNSKELSEIYARSHMGIGSMAMHRIGLKEGSVLKVREYLSAGLPVCFSYEDSDLKNSEEWMPFFVKFPANDEPISFETLVTYCNTFYAKEGGNEKIRQLADKHLSYKTKAKQLAQFLSSI